MARGLKLGSISISGGWGRRLETGSEEETDLVAIYLVRTGPVGYARPSSTAIARLFTETPFYPQTTEERNPKPSRRPGRAL